MNNLFFNQFSAPSNFTYEEKRTRSEQVDIKDRWIYTDHFENHPKGIKRYDAIKESSKPKKLGRPKKVQDYSKMGRKPIPFTKKELRMIEMRDQGYPRLKIAKRLGVTMSHVDRILNRVNWKASKQRKLLKGGSL